jgi:phosphoglycerate dehydrogenase-like enzyme
MPWSPKRVVVGARAHEALIGYIQKRRPDLQLRGAPHTDVTRDDLDWGEVYLGFRAPPHDDGWGGIRWIHCTGAGVDGFLYPDPIPDAILLTRTLEPFGPQIAEYCLSRALAFSQHLRRYERQQREGRWEQGLVDTLAGSRVLVVGTGEVGSAVARRFAALGCHVAGVSRSGRPNETFAEVWPSSELAAHVGDVQVLLLAAPLTHDTVHLVDREVLSHCRGALLVNVGRGQLVEEAALPEALDAGWLRGAALDVFEEEPLPSSSPLWTRDDVMVSPHVAGLTTIPGAADSFLESLTGLERGDAPAGLVDRARGY